MPRRSHFAITSFGQQERGAMSLHQLNDKVLMDKTESLVKEERELLTTILHHLREIERRRLFSALGYKSLFEMTVKKFHYSEDQAYRRIAAMRVMKELPEIEEKIESGDLTLSHIGVADALFKSEKSAGNVMERTAKLEVMEKIAGQSVREAERITFSISSSPGAMKSDRVKQVSDEHVELKFIANEKLREKIEKLKGLLAHKEPNISLGELFDKLCDLGLEKWDLSKKVATSRKRCVKVRMLNLESADKSDAQIRRDVFAKAKNKCENCESTFALEIDHIKPRAHGGDDNAENLRLLCRCCNQRAAIEKLGQVKMDRYLNGS